MSYKENEQVELIAFVFSNINKIPSGTVVFVENGRALGSARLDATGVARLKIAQNKIGPGDHHIIAHYAGTKEFAASFSETTIKTIK
jgi:hypothetical protein